MQIPNQTSMLQKGVRRRKQGLRPSSRHGSERARSGRRLCPPASSCEAREAGAGKEGAAQQWGVTGPTLTQTLHSTAGHSAAAFSMKGGLSARSCTRLHTLGR